MLINPSLLVYSVDRINYASYSNIFNWIRAHNENDEYVLVENYINEVPEDVAYYYNQRMLNTNYGFLLKNSPASYFARVSRPSPYNYAFSYNDIQPGYIITPHNSIVDMPNYAEKVYTVGDTSVFHLQKGKSFGEALDTDGNMTPVHVNFGINSFMINFKATQSAILSLVQMNYPGWSVSIDDKRAILSTNRFLETKIYPGTHKYRFTFFSRSFIIGAIISSASIGLWLLTVVLIKIWSQYVNVEHFFNPKNT